MNRERNFSKNSNSVLLVFISVIIGFIGGVRKDEIVAFVAPIFGFNYSSQNVDLSQVKKVYSNIINKFDGEIDKYKLIDGASKGMVDALGDEHTVYMDAAEAEEFNKNLSGDIGAGIGIELGKRNDRPTVIRTLKNNPAIKAGVLSGDIVVGVNGEDVSKKTVDYITSKIKGEAGTSVKVKIIRNNEEKEFSIVRQKIDLPSVELEILDDIAVMKISRFDGETGSLARKYAQEIKQKGISRMILDLRGNGGGYVSAAQSVASLWLEKNKLIVTEKKGPKVIDEIRASGDNILSDLKTVVLADGFSASASEIVVGALKDNNIAKIIGLKTYGKGSVQEIVDINDGLFKVTIAKWYSPSGKNIDKQGIEPDRKVEISEDQINSGKDPQLDAAKEELKNI